MDVAREGKEESGVEMVVGRKERTNPQAQSGAINHVVAAEFQ